MINMAPEGLEPTTLQVTGLKFLGMPYAEHFRHDSIYSELTEDKSATKVPPERQ